MRTKRPKNMPDDDALEKFIQVGGKKDNKRLSIFAEADRRIAELEERVNKLEKTRKRKKS